MGVASCVRLYFITLFNEYRKAQLGCLALKLSENLVLGSGTGNKTPGENCIYTSPVDWGTRQG